MARNGSATAVAKGWDAPRGELRRKRGAAFVRRDAKMIRRLQESGRGDPDLDRLVAALALSGMVGRIAYSLFSPGERIPFERLVTTLNQLWANALNLDQKPPTR